MKHPWRKTKRKGRAAAPRMSPKANAGDEFYYLIGTDLDAALESLEPVDPSASRRIMTSGW